MELNNSPIATQCGDCQAVSNFNNFIAWHLLCDTCNQGLNVNYLRGKRAPALSHRVIACCVVGSNFAIKLSSENEWEVWKL